MSESDVAQLRAELAQSRAEIAHLRERMADNEAILREVRDTLMQARGGMVLIRWLFGGTLATAIATFAAVYTWLKAH